MRSDRRDEPRNEVLLGFDVRELWVPVSEQWPSFRVQTYCLREATAKPLSTDHLVWPSVFEAGPSECRHNTGFGGRLWSSLSDMLACFERLKIDRETRAIAIALVWDSHASSNGVLWSSLIMRTAPEKVDQAWSLLGYDVSDQWLRSGLLNCGYSRHERHILQAHWSSKLNDSHLFENSGDALRFIEVCNARVPEHAPFFAYAIYAIPTTCPDKP